MKEKELKLIKTFLTKYFDENEFDQHSKMSKLDIIKKSINFYKKKADKIRYLETKLNSIYPENDDELNLYLIFTNNHINIDWDYYLNVSLINSPEFVETLQKRVFKNNLDTRLHNSKVYLRFFNLFSDMQRQRKSLYANMADMTSVLEIWSDFSEIEFLKLHIQVELNRLKPSNTKKEIQFEDIFEEGEFKIALDLLVTNKIVSFHEESYQIEVPVKFAKKGSQLFKSTIIYELNYYKYFKNANNVDLIDGFNRFFNENLSKQNYDSLLKSTRIDDYRAHLTFLKK